MIPMLILSAVLILVNGLFVLIEFALVRVRASRMEILARKGAFRAGRVKEILANLDVYLAALQLGITVVSLALGWIGEPALAKLMMLGFDRLPFHVPENALHGISFALALMLLAFAHIVLGELVPRSIGIQKAEAVSMWGALPITAFFRVFRVPVAFMSWCSVGILRVMGLKPAAGTEAVFSEEEMRLLLGETQEKGGLPLERLLLLENLFDFGKTTVAEAMVQMERVVVLSLAKSSEENFEVVRSRRFSRFPLCENGPNTVIGYIHIKDILTKMEGGRLPELGSIKRDLSEISLTDSLEKHLKAFPDLGIHMALVKGPKGENVGVLTLEDIVEEIIGEIHDEFDLREAWSLVELIAPAGVAVKLPESDVQGAIWQLLNKLKVVDPDLDTREAFGLIMEREKRFSSGIGRGVAVPHARLASLEKPLVALGRFFNPVPFAAPDKVPVRLVFLILTPSAAPRIQLKILARIASLAVNENIRRKLLRAKSAEVMLEILRVADTLLAV